MFLLRHGFNSPPPHHLTFTVIVYSLVMRTKVCCQCKLELPTSQFYRNRRRPDHLQTYCKECTNTHVQAQYYKNPGKWRRRERVATDRARDFIDQIRRTNKCAVCGETRWYTLVFHHSDPSVKEGNISQMTRMSISCIQAEMDKCELLCANCHLAFHHLQRHPEDAM